MTNPLCHGTLELAASDMNTIYSIDKPTTAVGHLYPGHQSSVAPAARAKRQRCTRVSRDVPFTWTNLVRGRGLVF